MANKPNTTTDTLPDTAQRALQTHFGFDEFRAGQETVINHLLNGRSAAAVFPTGSGKSLCYQLPALLFEGLTLVVSPLIALMKDQIDALTARGITAARLDSTLDAEQYQAVMQALQAGELRLLYVAPERFNNERFRERIKTLPIALFAVDEAHCISEWGHNFRPDYLKLAGFARECEAERVLALTATATERVLEDICERLEIAPECAERTGFYRANLQLYTTPVSLSERDAALLAALKQYPPGPAIIYVTQQKTAEDVAAWLVEEGLPALAYHAGMSADKRAAIQDRFMASDKAMVVATIAFGMGVDKANIRYVYHYNLPKSLEGWSQEIGRAGRDGAPALCQLFLCPDDLTVLQNFIYGDTPDAEAVADFLADLQALDDQFDVSHYSLSGSHDIRPVVVRTLLTYLELDGYLQGGTPFYSKYRFQPLLASEQILARFEGERRTFLANVFRHASKGRSWFSIDPGATAVALGTDRQRVVRALDWLGEQQLLKVEVSGVRHRYHWLRRPEAQGADLESGGDDLAHALWQRFVQREAAEIGRLQQVLDLATLNACRAAALAAYFGETLEHDCGQCSWCQQQNVPMPASSVVQGDRFINDQLAGQLAPLLEEHAELFATARPLARFLCGIGSPRIGRARLGKHALFGVIENIPFAEVLAWCESQLGAGQR